MGGAMEVRRADAKGRRGHAAWTRYSSQSAAAHAIGVLQSQLSKHLNRSRSSQGVDPINGWLCRVVA